MAENKIYQFADSVSALVLTDVEYEGDSQREIGNQIGIARADFVNKVLRQCSYMAAAIAQYVVDNAVETVQDSDTLATFGTNFTAAVSAALTAAFQDILTQEWVDAPTITIDWSLGSKAYGTLAGTGRTVVFSNFSEGQVCNMIIIQGSGGSKTITNWPGITWLSGGTYTGLSSLAGKADIITFVKVNSVIYGSIVKG